MRFYDGIPNCVPEYFREEQERQEREYELREKQMERYEKNKEKLEKAIQDGYSVLNYEGYPECCFCTQKESIVVSECDDMGTIICRNKNCECHRRKTEEIVAAEKEIVPDEKGSFTINDYKSQELLNELTVENVKAFAMKNYSKGGDCIIECMEDTEIAELIQKGGKSEVLDQMYCWYMKCLDIRSTIW